MTALRLEPAALGQQGVPPGHHVYAHTIHVCAPYFTDPNQRRWQHDRDVPPEWRRDYDVEQWRRQVTEANVGRVEQRTIGTWMLDHERGYWRWVGFSPAVCG